MAHFIADLTGPSRTGGFGVGSTDLGYFVDTGRGYCLALFGDSFAGESPEASGDWRSPIALRTASAEPAAGIQWDSAVGGDRARQLFDYARRGNAGKLDRPITWIVADGVVLPDGQLIMAAFAVSAWQHEASTWATQSCDWFVSTVDEDEHWAPCPTHSGGRLGWQNDGVGACFQNQSLVHHGEYIYVFGTPAGRTAGARIHLMRAPIARYDEPEAWEYWGHHDGHWAWGGHAPTPILSTLAPWSAIGELNVRAVDGRFVMSYVDAGVIWTRVADAPDAPWSLPRPAIGADEAPALYAPAIHPWSHLDNLTIGLSQWIRDGDATRFYGVRQWQIDARPSALDRVRLARRVDEVAADADAATPLIDSDDPAVLARLVEALRDAD